MAHKIRAAIIGSGNIGTDLMIKIIESGVNVEIDTVVGIDIASDGLQRARDKGVNTIHEGVEGLVNHPNFKKIDIIFDATSANAHLHNEQVLRALKPNIKMIDLTPAAIGPYCVPVVNLHKHINENNVNMVTCGGQATIPIVHAVSTVTKVHYAEIVASISSLSAGPGTRANIDEFTETTSSAIETLGNATKGKAIIVLNPADPPILMRDTVYCFTDNVDQDAIRKAIEETVFKVNQYVPGYRLKQDVQFEVIPEDKPLNLPSIGYCSGLKISVYLEVEGAAHYLPAYAGNLDIMTSAALVTAEEIALNLKNQKEA